MTSPFDYQDPYSLGGGGLSGALGAIGAPAGLDWDAALQQALAAGDFQGASSIQSMRNQQSAFADQSAAMKAMTAPPSKWATGAQTFGNIAQGLAGLGSIYLGWQGLKEQKKEFKFNKEVTNTNLNNSILDYNRRLGDVLQNRALNNGQGQGWVSSELAKYSAKRSGG